MARLIRKLLISSMAALVFVVALSSPASAAGIGQSRASGLALYRQVNRDFKVPAGWTGSTKQCKVGREALRSQRATRRTVNALRGLAGLKPISLSKASNRRALAAAMLMRANNALSHSPPSTWRCFSREAELGAGRSNLYLGLSGARAMVGYVQDQGVSSLGHRLWLLNPTALVIGTGSTGTTNALYVVGGKDRPWSATNDQGQQLPVVWPPPAWVSWNWVFSSWSATLPQTSSEALPRVRVATGTKQLKVLGVRYLAEGYGSGRAVAWRVRIPAAMRRSDRKLRVRIKAGDLDYRYTVRAFHATR